MNKKLVLLLAGLGLWLLVIGGFGLYYLSVGELQNEQANKSQKEVTELATDGNPPIIQNNPRENIEKAVETPKAKIVQESDAKSISINNLVKQEVKIEPKETTKTDTEKSAVIKAEETPEEKGGITIRGNVIDLKTDRAIENVNVAFYTNEGEFLKNANTDKDGHFETKGIKAKAIHVRLQREHYIKAVYKNLTLEELQEHQLYKLDPGVMISGIVKDKETKSPLVGVNIDLYRGNTILKKSDKTDANGLFKVDAVPQGSLELVFSKIGFSQGGQTINVEKSAIPSLEIYLEKSSSLIIEVVTLGGYVAIPKIRVYFDGNNEAKVYERSILSEDQGKNIFRLTGIDRQYSKLRVHADGFTFPAEKPLEITPGKETKVIFEVDKGMSVNGVVHGIKGNLLSGVTINLYEVFGGGRAVGDDVLKGTVATDSNGKFTVGGVTQGSIEIITTSTIYKRFQKKFLVEEKNNPDIDIELEVESFFTGLVTDVDNKPIAISEVRFVPIRSDGIYDGKRDRPIFEGSSNVGEFKMSGVVPGLYRLSITANGYVAYIEERYEVKTDQGSGNFKMVKGLSVTGEIKSESGAPIVDAEVRLLVSMKESNVKYKSISDFNGFFVISGLEENVIYKMQVQGKGYQLYEKEINLKQGATHFPIVLVKKLSYSGVVLDGATQLPIQNFQIKIYGKYAQSIIDDSMENFNTSNGQFSMPVNSEVFNVEIKASGFSIYNLKNVKISDPVQNHFLSKAGSINFKVMMGKEPASMKLILLSKTKDIESDEDKLNVRTDSTGNALAQNLKPGEYYIRISNVFGYANYDDSVFVKEEVETQKNIVLIPGLSIKGRVLNAVTNIPVVSGEVYLDREKYIKFPLKVYLNPDGFFEFKNALPGKHALTIAYGPIENGKFSKTTVIEVVVPDRVNNPNGIYVVDDILIK